MEATIGEAAIAGARERWVEEQRRVDELAVLSAHVSAATARFVELVAELREVGDIDEFPRFVAYRFGITTREAREYLRVAEALRELPVIRAAFARGEVTFSKVRCLTRVATASSEVGLLELAGVLTASQLERALRVFRRITTEQACVSHELEFVDYHFAEDGSLMLRARLAAEDGVLVVKALEAARNRVLERRREERSACEGGPLEAAAPAGTERPTGVEALVDLAGASLEPSEESAAAESRLVVHVDAAALTTDGRGRSELENGPVISPETARRLGCDAEVVAQVERDGLPVSVGRSRRTVPPSLRRLLEARDEDTCCFPGCERRRHLQAHHRTHWAHGGETSLDNLVLLCWHHHRLVHEGGYTIEDDPDCGGLRFRNRYGVVTPTAPPRPPPGSPDELITDNRRRGLEIDPRTNRHGVGEPQDLAQTINAILSIAA
jgi:hypothetical protein